MSDKKSKRDFVADTTKTHCCDNMTLTPTLYDELVVEILSWLPVKSLVRFKCVSKYFKSLISDPSFVKLHLQRSPKNANLLITSEDSFSHGFVMPCSMSSSLKNPSSIIVENLDSRPNLMDEYRVLDSCNGLVCLITQSTKPSPGEDRPHKEYSVRFWNPATRLTSQKSPDLIVYPRGCCNTLAVFGFGYDNLSDTYKVVSILKNQKEIFNIKVKVYNIGDNCWRNIQSFPGIPLNRHTGVYLSRTLNWLARPRPRPYPRNFSNPPDTVYKRLIVSLDLGEETYKQLFSPPIDDTVFPSLGVLKGCLCFSQHYERTDLALALWQMKEFGVENSWTPILKVGYEDLQINRWQRQSFPMLLPLCMFENGDVLIMVKTDTYGSQAQLILYNQKDNRAEHIETSNKISWAYVMD